MMTPEESAAQQIQSSKVLALRHKPMAKIRAGLIGLGERGTEHLEQLTQFKEIEILAVCDPIEGALRKAQTICTQEDRQAPSTYSKGKTDYKRMLERDDLDIIIISTPWNWHARQAVDAMNAGKHAFIEVPAAVTIDECWELVETAEKTQQHCMMLENVCYGRNELMALNMCRAGLLGELTHGEGAYIHDLRKQMHQIDSGTGSWRTLHHTKRNGNLYPTHGLGPISQCMGINRGDRLNYLVSMGSPALGRAKYAKEHFPASDPRNSSTYKCSDINSTLIQTARGRSILIQHDTTTPRPYTRKYLLQGTEGIIQGFPDRIALDTKKGAHEWHNLKKYQRKYEHPLWKRIGEEAEENGGHGGMDFVMLWRLIDCLKNGEALDQSVYDAASWSAIAELSERSVAKKSAPIQVPDFTRGAWRDTPALGIVGNR